MIGTFTQFPLKLAWAITIHKSQGLTFERAIIDANAAFAHGQVYVALSRCKTFEGIVLRSPIAMSSIRTDNVVRGYSADIDKNTPTEADLVASKIVFQKNLIEDLFDFKALKYLFKQANQTLLGNDHTIQKAAIDIFKAAYIQAENDVFAVADKFIPQMQFYLMQEGLPEENAALQERLQKAGVYFEDKLKKGLFAALTPMRIETDNKAIGKAAKEAVDAVQKEIFIKNACFVTVQIGFNTNQYLRTKADAEIDFAATQVSEVAPKALPQTNTPNPELYARLHKWRARMAANKETETYFILTTASLYELVEKLPTTLNELGSIKGIGAAKIKQFGVDIADIIQEYCEDFGIDKSQLKFADPKIAKPKAPKSDTKQSSFDLFKAGKTIAEIAAARGLTAGTIETHLTHYVGTGELSINELMDEEKLTEIQAFFIDNNTTVMNDAMAHFGGKYTYADFRLVLKYIGNKEE